jgi:hypothetical protein
VAFYNASGVALTGITVTWASSNTGAATVDNDGLVTPVGAGSANITADYQGVHLASSYLVTSTVQTVTSVVITGPASVVEGQSITLTATPKDASGNTVLGQTMTWLEGTGAGDVTVSADSGADPHTSDIVGVTAGTRNVTATCNSVTSSNYAVLVTTPSVPGSYVPITGFSFRADNYSTVASIPDITVYNNQHNSQTPVLPYTQFFTLRTVSDRPNFDTGVVGAGNLLRFRGGLDLNPYPLIIEALSVGTAGNSIVVASRDPTGAGAVRDIHVQDNLTSPTITEVFVNLRRGDVVTALNTGGLYTGGTPRGKSDNLPSVLVRANPNFNVVGNPQPPGGNATAGFNALSGGTASVKAQIQFADNVAGRQPSYNRGFGAGNAKYHLWLKIIFRFTTNWTTDATFGGQGVGGDKLIFFRNQTGRYEWELGVGQRAWMNLASGTGGSNPLPAAWNTVISMNQQFNTSGYGFPDIYSDHTEQAAGYPHWKMVNVPSQRPNNTTVYGLGQGEYFEMIMHARLNHTGSPPFEQVFTESIRQITVAGAYSPLPWRHFAEVRTATVASNPFLSLQFGQTRNRGYDETEMGWDIVGFDLVDGEVYADPFALGVGL